MVFAITMHIHYNHMRFQSAFSQRSLSDTYYVQKHSLISGHKLAGGGGGGGGD